MSQPLYGIVTRAPDALLASIAAEKPHLWAFKNMQVNDMVVYPESMAYKARSAVRGYAARQNRDSFSGQIRFTASICRLDGDITIVRTA